MQEADDVPIWNEDSEEKDEIDGHFNTEDLHKVSEFDETKGEEEHIEWELVRQNDLIVAVENGHPHDFWIDTKAKRNVCERCGECGADGQWRENEVNEYAQRPNGKEDNGETLSFEVWHESIANHFTNTEVGADGTNAHAGSNENDEWKIGVFDIVCGANVKAWDVGKHWHKGKDPCNVDAVDGLSPTKRRMQMTSPFFSFVSIGPSLAYSAWNHSLPLMWVSGLKILVVNQNMTT